MARLDAQARADIEAIRSLPPEIRKNIKEETDKIMKSIVERIHYAESRRNGFCTVAAALIAGGLASITVENTVLQGCQRTISMYASVSLMILGVMIFILYASQTNYKYPFNTITTTWKWFYRDALFGLSEISIPFTTLECDETKKQVASKIHNAWPSFVNNYTTRLADESESLWQDIQQVFILHLNEKYKNQFLTNLRRLLNTGLITISVFYIASMASLYFFNN